MRDSVITINGPTAYAENMDPRGMSDVEAGIFFLGALDKLAPGITWSDLAAMNSPALNGWNLFRATGNLLGDAKDLVGEVVRGTGDAIGKAVRLVTSPQVVSAAQAGAAAYASGGGSTILDDLTGGKGSDIEGILGKIGSVFKGVLSGGGGSAKAGNGEWPELMKNPYLWGGIAAATGLYFVMGGKRAKR